MPSPEEIVGNSMSMVRSKPSALHSPFSGRTASPQPTAGSSSEHGLHSLADGEPNERPPYSNFTLVKCAILGSPRQKLTLSEIYRTILARFPWFETAGKGWKNSVRHCLSLDTQFLKEPRPPTEPGKGCYWTVSLDTPRGNKRERKRNKKATKREIAAEEARLRSNPPASFPLTTPAFRDYATTVPKQVNIGEPALLHLPAPPPTQSGWTPYFPTVAMMSAPLPILRGHYTEMSWQSVDTLPSAPTLCNLSPVDQERDDRSEEGGSDAAESDAKNLS